MILGDAMPLGRVAAAVGHYKAKQMDAYPQRMNQMRIGAPYVKANRAVLTSVESECSEVVVSSRRMCIIVCGMHRTGTSVVARVVNLLGADLPKDLVPPDAANVRGYWEPSAVVQIHDELLEALGTSSADPLPPQKEWLELACTQQAKVKLASMIDAEFSESRLFVMKDPRIAKLLPLWLKLLDDLHVDTAVVIPFRHPLDVAASLKIRDNMSSATSLLLYVNSYLNAELWSRGRRRCFVNYDELLSDWRHLRRKLAGILGGRLPDQETQEKSSAIEGYLSPDLRHHEHNRDDLMRLTDVPSSVGDLYDLLNDASLGNDPTGLQKSFDRLRRSADESAKLYRTFVSDERARWKDAINQFESSKSWQVTAPLRWMNRFFNL